MLQNVSLQNTRSIYLVVWSIYTGALIAMNILIFLIRYTLQFQLILSPYHLLATTIERLMHLLLLYFMLYCMWKIYCGYDLSSFKLFQWLNTQNQDSILITFVFRCKSFFYFYISVNPFTTIQRNSITNTKAKHFKITRESI